MSRHKNTEKARIRPVMKHNPERNDPHKPIVVSFNLMRFLYLMDLPTFTGKDIEDYSLKVEARIFKR